MRVPVGTAVAMSIWMAVMLPWLGVSPVLASGSANCSELGATNRWVGQQASTTGQRHGAKGTFELWALVQCSNPGLFEVSGSFVFSNIVPTDGGFNDIIQVGAGNCRAPIECASGMTYYEGWGITSTTPGCSTFEDTAPAPFNLGAWTSHTHTYTVQHISNVWKFIVDGTTLDSIPESWICWTPRSASWFGESWDYGDQIGGTATDHLTISSTQYTSIEGGGWANTAFNASNACNYVASHPPFFCDVTQTNELDIWTNR